MGSFAAVQDLPTLPADTKHSLRSDVPFALIRRHPCFRGLSDVAAERLLSGLPISSSNTRDHPIYPETHSEIRPEIHLEDDIFRVVILFQGVLREVLLDPDGRELLVDMLQAPALVFFQGRSSEGSATSRSFCVVERASWVEIPRERIVMVARSHPEFMVGIIELMSDEMEKRRRLLYSVAFESVRVRLARLIASYADLYGREATLGECNREDLPPDQHAHREGDSAKPSILIDRVLPYERLADDLGVAKRSIDRALEDWMRRGWIIRRKGKFILSSLTHILRSTGLESRPTSTLSRVAR